IISSIIFSSRGARLNTNAIAAKNIAQGFFEQMAADEFETHPAFDDRERAALALARDAAAHPPAVDDGHFEALRRHFDEDAIVELVAVIALSGFLNRFNDTMAKTLEDEPLAFARARLAASGWEPGAHAPGDRR
ncbi:MAG: carboxymuconolactone decarboxylase family protein, partial [Myxococcota bacterium]|nr:carboxymuconolactone decarboxylase family protein [Myxococcota bacterium]